jgi:hypothetical protein
MQGRQESAEARRPHSAPTIGRRIAVRLARLIAHGARFVADRADDLATAWQARGAARLGRLRALNRTPLPNIYEVHPEARTLPAREIGLRPIPLDQIAGTAVAGPAQRGSDFKPMPPFRSRNWQARWQRIRSAYDRLEVLPSIEVVRYADRYWLLDGHNRVAAALDNGQVEIDAVVTELRAPGTVSTEPPAPLAPVMTEAADLRAAGAGRWSPTVPMSSGDVFESELETAEGPKPMPREEAAQDQGPGR